MDNMIYRCGICGKEYDTVEARMECEKKCIKLHKEELEKKKQEELQKEKNRRYDEVIAAIDNVDKLIREYVNDYHSIKIDDYKEYDNKNFRPLMWWDFL